jgi:GT2 family glycosyltransferase
MMKTPFLDGTPQTLRVQSVLFKNSPVDVDRTLEAITRSIELAIRAGVIANAHVALADCSQFPIYTPSDLENRRLELLTKGLSELTYEFFGENLGHGGGHNRLLSQATASLVLILNPDVIVGPNVVSELCRLLRLPGVGQVEARQIPLEHPKDFDHISGETSWASGACVMVPLSVLTEVGGFDADTFFLYCDDVDLSWRVRLAGYKVLFQPSAAAFHDKRLSREAKWVASGAEEYYSAEAGLLLPYKYSRPDLVERNLACLENSASEAERRAATEYRKRLEHNRMPTPLDVEHRVAEFIEGNYARHRF